MARTNDARDNAFEEQTTNLLDFISGTRSSRRMEEDTQAVLENLRGNRDHDEPIQPLTREYLQQAANGLPPNQILAQVEESARDFARENLPEYHASLNQAVAAGLLSENQATALRSVNHRPMFTAMQAALDADDVLGLIGAVNMPAPQLNPSRLELWTQQRRLEQIQQQLRNNTTGNATTAADIEATLAVRPRTARQQQQRQRVAAEPEPEPEPRASVFDSLVNTQRAPRRILKLKKPKTSKD